MITNVQRAVSLGDIQRYVRYTIAPEQDNKNPNYVHGERTLSIESDNINLDFDIDRNKTSHSIANQITKWNREYRQGQKKPAKPAVFGSISFSPEDTNSFMSKSSIAGQPDYLDHKKVLEVARKAIVKTMGGNRPIYLCLHGDKEHLHVHFVVGLVNDQGQIWSTPGERDFRAWERTNETIEIEHGLKRVEHRKAFQTENEHREAPLKRLRDSEVHLANKGELTPLAVLQGRLEDAYKSSNGNFGKFLEETETKNIRIKPNMSTTKVNGLSFSLDGDNYVKGSDVGSKYKWSKLSKGLNYDSERDYQKLAELGHRQSKEREGIEVSNASIVRHADSIRAIIEESKTDNSEEYNTRIIQSDSELNIGQIEQVRQTSNEHQASENSMADVWSSTNSNSSNKSSGYGFGIEPNNLHEAGTATERDIVIGTESSTETIANASTDAVTTSSTETEEIDEATILRIAKFGNMSFRDAKYFYLHEQKRHIKEKLTVTETWTPDKGLNKRLAESKQLDIADAIRGKEPEQQTVVITTNVDTDTNPTGGMDGPPM